MERWRDGRNREMGEIERTVETERQRDRKTEKPKPNPNPNPPKSVHSNDCHISTSAGTISASGL